MVPYSVSEFSSKENENLADKNATVVESFVKDGHVVYGITTGIGSFADF
jgi:histidine ammonia-lyase